MGGTLTTVGLKRRIEQCLTRSRQRKHTHFSVVRRCIPPGSADGINARSTRLIILQPERSLVTWPLTSLIKYVSYSLYSLKYRHEELMYSPNGNVSSSSPLVNPFQVSSRSKGWMPLDMHYSIVLWCETAPRVVRRNLCCASINHSDEPLISREADVKQDVNERKLAHIVWLTATIQAILRPSWSHHQVCLEYHA